MKIIALDSYAVDYEGLTWDAVADLGDFRAYPRTPAEEVTARAKDADAILVNKIKLSDEVLKSLPRLRYIGVTATGTDNVDLSAAKQQNIAVSNVPAYSTDSVAELVFSFMLSLSRRIGEYDSAVHRSEWVTSRDFCLPLFPTFELAGKTLGILGYGTIGRRVADIAKAFNMELLIGALPGREYTDQRLGLEELFSRVDFLTLHCPLTPATEKLISTPLLKLMKASAIIINTSRGGVIDEPALAEALNLGHLAGAGIDVLSSEPPKANNPLLTAKNCLITPHVAWSTREARSRLMAEVAKNLKAFIEGNRRNRVES